VEAAASVGSGASVGAEVGSSVATGSAAVGVEVATTAGACAASGAGGSTEAVQAATNNKGIKMSKTRYFIFSRPSS
jgi:hypothetical protein